MNGILARLRDRKLVRWLLAYLAAAWVLAQIAAYVGELFGWPEALQRAIAVMLGAGVLPAGVLAWFHGERGSQKVGKGEVMLLTLALALTATAGWWAAYSAPASPPVSTIPPKPPSSFEKLRIAILPLQNLGEVPANAMFTSGFHDTLITQVARIPGLTVISRTSVMQWQGEHPSLREVAEALEVGTVLEGSVQRDGDQVRIHAQLIDTASDAHLWAETFDRTVGDLFAVQSEIATVIAAKLEQQLTGEQRQLLDTPPTSEPRAYEQLMLARALMARDDRHAAEAALETAVAFDPRSAVLYAELSTVRSWMYIHERSGERKAAARAALDRALALDAGRAEVQLALATYHYWGEQDNERAVDIALPALAALPNEATGRVAIGFVLRRLGRWQDAHALFLRAEELDPRNVWALRGVRSSAIALRNRADFARACRRGEALDPASGGSDWFCPAFEAMGFDGDLRPMVSALLSLPPALRPLNMDLAVRAALNTSDFAAARHLLERYPFPVEEPGPGDREEALGHALRGSGAIPEARQQFELALQAVRERLEAAAPDDIRILVWLHAKAGYREVLLGNADLGLAEIQRAIEMLPFEQDAAEGAEALLFLASAHAELGRKDEAIATLERLFSRPTMVVPGIVWISRENTSLRDDPRFRRLLAAQGVNVDNDPRDAAAPPGAFARW